mmetsp:Transcript_57558/g.178721  ORF Transcript_57558/g.178721 Transcript_57558/m.178721 type:complete len:212 (-) Transcript_57558:1090-1725(-)
MIATSWRPLRNAHWRSLPRTGRRPTPTQQPPATQTRTHLRTGRRPTPTPQPPATQTRTRLRTDLLLVRRSPAEVQRVQPPALRRNCRARREPRTRASTLRRTVRRTLRRARRRSLTSGSLFQRVAGHVRASRSRSGRRPSAVWHGTCTCRRRRSARGHKRRRPRGPCSRRSAGRTSAHVAPIGRRRCDASGTWRPLCGGIGTGRCRSPPGS